MKPEERREQWPSSTLLKLFTSRQHCRKVGFGNFGDTFQAAIGIVAFGFVKDCRFTVPTFKRGNGDTERESQRGRLQRVKTQNPALLLAEQFQSEESTRKANPSPFQRDGESEAKHNY